MSIATFFSVGAKRPREEAVEAKRAPATLCAWNANSLLGRVSKDSTVLAAFLDNEAPDIIFVSEVRMAAAGPPGCKKDDGKPRRRAEPSKATPALAREAEDLTAFLRKHNYRAYYSLSDSKYSGVALLVRRDVKQPTALRFSLDLAAPDATHHPEGRVIVASFDGLDVLGTYSPNNGMTIASLARRRAWDAEVSAFLVDRPGRASGKPFAWVGDLNVAAAWEDVGPSPEWFRHKNGQEATDESDRGQPGFTPNEQSRFQSICEAGGLVDAYRLLHPQPDWSVDSTWRGTPGAHGVPEAGRYYGKGMRIDYVLVDSATAPRVSHATVHGKGPDRAGFLGSDHCPLIVSLAPSPAESRGEGAAAASGSSSSSASASGSASVGAT